MQNVSTDVTVVYRERRQRKVYLEIGICIGMRP